MGARSSTRDDKIQRFHQITDGAALRFVDMRLDFEHEGEILLSVGGVWDLVESKQTREYVRESEMRVVVRIHEGQEPAVRWFSTWLAAHAHRRGSPPAFTLDELDRYVVDVDPAHAYSALFAGGRRGGKSWVAAADGTAYAVAFPGSIVWICSPSDQKHDEMRRYLAGVIPPEWLERQTAFEYELVNGSTIYLKSAHLADGLKEGKADFVILNEGQMMKKRAFTVARGAIVDSSGLVLVCANPPVEKNDQVWVSDFAADAAAGKRASVFVEFNPLLNPHIDRRALMSMAAEVDERTFAIEVLGQFRGPADAVAYNWQRLENERKPDERKYEDVTARFLAAEEEGPGIEILLGLDVQRFPYIGGPAYKFYVPHGAAPTRDNVIAWIVGEVVLDGGDEVDYCAHARELGYLPASTLIVCDATAEYQHSRRRSTDAPPPEWKGRGSYSIIRGEGYRRIVPPDRRFRKKNPPIVDRMRAFTSMISTRAGVRRLFADPDAAPRTCKAIREWRVLHGTPHRTADEAHLGDGASYPISRLFPRILRSGKPGAMDPVIAKVDRDRVAAEATPLRIVPPPRGPSSPRRSGRGSRTRGL